MLSVLNLGQLICPTNWVNVSVIWVCFMELSIMLAFVVFVHIYWFLGDVGAGIGQSETD